MTVFQLIVTPVALVLFVHALRKYARRDRQKRVWLLAAMLWLATVLCLLKPDVTMVVARSLGIGRGADLILYVTVISFSASLFYFYGRVHTLESEITELVRHIALVEGGRTSS